MGPYESDESSPLYYDTVQSVESASRRRRSSNSFTVEELSEEDYAYDGDIEIVRPDQYEEADSDTGGLDSPPTLQQESTYWQSRLAEKLTALNCNSDTNESQENTDRPPSRKRRSRGQTTDNGAGKVGRRTSASLEVVELADGSGAAPPAKRRRRKSRRSRTSEQSVHLLPSAKAEQADIGKNAVTSMTASGSSTTSLSSPQTPTEDMMEID
jgi:hypothetical protein